MYNTDKTLENNYLKGFIAKIRDYEMVKQKKHPIFKTVKEFCEQYHTNRQTFLRVYNRYKQSNNEVDLLPRIRGPKWRSRRTDINIENEVIKLRQLGLNRYEIHSILINKIKDKAPSPSCIYNITRRYNLNRLKPKMKEEKKRIIKEKAGELAHIDCHYLNKTIFNKRYYLVAIIDSCTRIAWAEVIDDIKSLTVMFSILRCMNMINSRYNIQFEEVLTDNGAEFGSGKAYNNKLEHPFERMLIEMGIKHKYTRPDRPQPNGIVERFWQTLNDDMIEDPDFDSIEELKDELLKYLIYYNDYRPHQALSGQSPKDFHLKLCNKSINVCN